jgi:hypothetical protein
MLDTSKLNYNPETGLFTWAKKGRAIVKGGIAGSKTVEGYWQIKLGYSVYRAHRLAWYIVNSAWPENEIDHINGDRSDNRIDNLRVVDRAGNSQNRRKAMKNNFSSGLLGVSWHKQHKKWKAAIMVNKKNRFLGYFDDANKAHAVYLEAKSAFHINGGCY